MNPETAVTNFQTEIIRIATEKLGRSLTEKESQFVASREGFIALEVILDTVKAENKHRVAQYLNSE